MASGKGFATRAQLLPAEHRLVQAVAAGAAAQTANPQQVAAKGAQLPALVHSVPTAARVEGAGRALLPALAAGVTLLCGPLVQHPAWHALPRGRHQPPGRAALLLQPQVQVQVAADEVPGCDTLSVQLLATRPSSADHSV